MRYINYYDLKALIYIQLVMGNIKVQIFFTVFSKKKLKRNMDFRKF